MAEPINRNSGDIPRAIKTAYDRGHPIAVGYVDEAGYPSLSFRGSLAIRNDTQLTLWARTPESGLAAAIAERPQVGLTFYATNEPGPMMLLTIKGTARVDPSLNDEVWAGLSEVELDHDKERKGVAVVIDVTRLSGFSPDAGPFEQSA